MKPLFDNILVEPIKGSVFGESENKGKATAIGEDVKNIKIGDTVYFIESTKLDDHLIVSESNILAKE